MYIPGKWILVGTWGLVDIKIVDTSSEILRVEYGYSFHFTTVLDPYVTQVSPHNVHRVGHSISMMSQI